MNNAYTYDAVNNVTKIANTGAVVNTTTGTIGGGITHNYFYDNLYRLDSANGEFIAGAKKANYGLRMRYDNMHNIVYKKQDIVQKGVQFTGALNAGYELFYTINANNSQQIANIADASYRVDRGTNGTYQLGKQTGDEVTVRAEDYTYDANGNLIYVLKGNRKPDSTLQVINSRKLLWDEENRLLSINDNGFVSNYWYDASGERTVKQSYDNEGVNVNGAQSAARTGTTKFTAYISPYLVVSNGGNYTKHIYMGSQRITSKVSNSGIFKPEDNPVNTTEQQAKLTAQTSKIKERFDTLGVTYSGIQQTGGLVSTPPLGGWGANPSGGWGAYFYHSDHLGSSSLITDATGAIVQHIEYVPFGETFLEERNGNWQTPYLFNAKERDEETGLYYYHARYYDSKRSVWLSVDPLAEKYFWTSSYVYCLNNPTNFIDPDGRSTHTDNKGNVIAVVKDKDLGVYRHQYNKDGSVPTQYQIEKRQKKYGVSGGGENMGETEFEDEFINPSNGKVMTNYQIDFDGNWNPIIASLGEKAKEMSPLNVAQESGNNGIFDIKSKDDYKNKAMKLNGKYATDRSAGNYLAGYNARQTGISFDKFQQMAGELHYRKNVANIPFPLADKAKIYAGLAKPHERAPLYGEIPYQYRMSKKGFENGPPFYLKYHPY